MEDQLPLALPEEKTECEVDADCGETQGRRDAADDPASAGKRLVRGQWVFPPGWRRVLLELGHGLAEGELVGGFERGSTNAAQDGRAVAADQRIMHGSRTRRAPKVGSRVRLRRGWDTGHYLPSIAYAQSDL
jgi:hypothetical protein